MRRKTALMMLAIVTVAALTCIGGFCGGCLGITGDKINREEIKKVSWPEQDCVILGSCGDGSALYVGVICRKDRSDAKYFLYINRGGFSFGWHLLKSEKLTDPDGLLKFDCGRYGNAYAALNAAHNIQRIAFKDGREPAVVSTHSPIAEQSQQDVVFYDQKGNPVKPSVINAMD